MYVLPYVSRVSPECFQSVSRVSPECPPSVSRGCPAYVPNVDPVALGSVSGALGRLPAVSPERLPSGYGRCLRGPGSMARSVASVSRVAMVGASRVPPECFPGVSRVPPEWLPSGINIYIHI